MKNACATLLLPSGGQQQGETNIPFTNLAIKRKKQKPAPESYRLRTYRHLIDAAGLVSFFVSIGETDLHILASTELSETARQLTLQYRNQLESYIAGHRRFLTSLAPLPADPLAPKIARAMLAAGQAATVGPMAAVAGAIAEFVGRGLLDAGAAEVMVENGGDIFLQRSKGCVIGIFAGTSPLSGKLGIKIPATAMPLGICTSSGTVGHSLSFGQADSVTVLARSVSLADALATRLGNEIKAGEDLDRALALARTVTGIAGAVIIKDEHVGAWGSVELVGLG